MLKALLKKQMMEVNAWLFQDKKKGKARSKSGIIMLIVLYTVLFAMLGSMFYIVGISLCEPLVMADLGWLYFALMGLIAVMLGVFGSVFNTYATLYQAKDNSFLLSMPVPPAKILMVRLFGVWMWSLIYEAIVFIPALIVYWTAAEVTVPIVVLDIAILLVLSVFVLTLACILGWVVAKISAKLRNKSIITVLVSIVFLGAYYYVYFRANALLQTVLQNAQAMGQKIRGAVYPIYLMGRAGEGDILSMVLFTSMIAALFALTYIILSRSFLKMATEGQGAARKKYKETAAKKRTLDRALLAKESKRFLSSPTYMLNCGLGTLFLFIGAAVVLIKGSMLRELVNQLGGLEAWISLIATALLCTLSAMNDISAPSVSLEGKNIWLVQVLPVPAWKALQAKLKLHLICTEIPTIICAICIATVLQVDIWTGVLITLVPVSFVLFSACIGLTLNLKSPNLKWTNETVPVKQSMAVMLSMFGSWAVIVAMGGLYILIQDWISSNLFLLLCFGLLGMFAALLLCWLKKRGTVIFEELS